MSTLSEFSSQIIVVLAISRAVASPLPPLEGDSECVGLRPLLPLWAGADMVLTGLGPLLPLWASANNIVLGIGNFSLTL